MKFYDVDGDGHISYDEFLSGLRDELSERRLNMVKKAFARLDRDGSG
jgi:Ca2+-binding EF-hand superfamily protein